MNPPPGVGAAAAGVPYAAPPPPPPYRGVGAPPPCPVVAPGVGASKARAAGVGAASHAAGVREPEKAVALAEEDDADEVWKGVEELGFHVEACACAHEERVLASGGGEKDAN